LLLELGSRLLLMGIEGKYFIGSWSLLLSFKGCREAVILLAKVSR